MNNKDEFIAELRLACIDEINHLGVDVAAEKLGIGKTGIEAHLWRNTWSGETVLDIAAKLGILQEVDIIRK